MDVEFQTNANPISSATKSEPSDNHASYSSGNGYKATPVMNNVTSIILCIVIIIQSHYKHKGQ